MVSNTLGLMHTEFLEDNCQKLSDLREDTCMKTARACLLRTRPGGVLLKKESGARTTAPRSAACISCAATKPPFANENALNCTTLRD